MPPQACLLTEDYGEGLLPSPPAPAPNEERRSLDRELARRCVRGELDAQRELVRQYSGLLWSLCLRSGLQRADAEDVCQEVLVNAFRALPRYRGDARLSTWLSTLTLRRIADYRRSPARRQAPSGAPSDEGFPTLPSEPSQSPEHKASESQRGERVREAIARLPDPARSVLVAYYLGEVPVTEIARTFGLPEGTVKTHLHRGRQALRQHLRDLC
jgi:RNA polymerase sigma-70 factor (ECF subfamily)